MATERLANEKYVSWLKVGLSLNFAKEGLESFTDDEAKNFHNNIQRSLTRSSSTGSHTCSDKISLRKQWQKRTFSCQAGNCDKWLTEIRRCHVNPTSQIEWGNSDVSKLSTQPWECAKLYMPYGCVNQTCAKDADIAALLTLYLKCTHFNALFSPVADCQKVKDIRNRIMHSDSMEVETSTMQSDIGVIVTFLEDPQQLIHEKGCTDAVRKIKELISGKMELSLNKELELRVLHSKLRSLENIVDQLTDSCGNLATTVQNLSTDTARDAEELKQLKSESQTMNLDFNSTKHELTEVQSQIEAFDTFLKDNKINGANTKKLSEVDGKLCSLKNDMDLVKKQWDDLTAKMSKHAEKLTKHEEILTEHEKTLTEHKEKLSEHKEKLPQHDDTLAEHKGKLTEHKDKLTKHEETLNEHEENLAENKETLTDHKEKLIEHEKKLTEHGEELTEYKAKHTKCNEKLTEHEEKLAEHKEKLTEWTEKLTKNRETLGEHDEKLAEHKGALRNHRETLREHKDKLTEQEAKLTEQKAKFTEHEEKLTEHEEKLIEHERTLTDHKKIHTEYKANIIEHKEKLAEHEKQHTEHRQKLTEHDLELRQIKKDQKDQNRKYCIADIKQYLITRYERYSQMVPIYPLRPECKKRVEDLYVEPKLIVEDPRGRCVHQDIHNRDQIKVDKVEDIFYTNGKLCKDIYVSGESGCGKSCLCEHLVGLWIRSQDGPRPLLQDESVMNIFTLLFYVPLRNINRKCKECINVENMILSHLQLGRIVSEKELSTLLLHNECLIILDGLDELTRVANLPERGYSEKCSILTTSRPWKLELLSRELEGNIDRQISIIGLEEASQEKLASNVVNLLNSDHGRNKSADQFMQDMEEQDLTLYLKTPVLLMQMLGLWYSEKPLGNSQCAIYCNMIDKQIEFTDKVRGLLKDEQTHEAVCQDQLPACFTNKSFCNKYKSVLFQVSKLAYERLFDKNQEYSLVFDHDQTEICGMSDDVVKQLLHMGILTQHKVFGEIAEELKSISFLHKSHQEFFCAVHLSTKCQRTELSDLFSEIICDLDRALELENIFLFVCGMNAKVAAELYETIMEKASSDARLQNYRQSLDDDHSGLIDRIQDIIIAGADEARKNNQSTAALKLQDIFVDVRYDGSRTERIFACDTSHARSICMWTPGDVTSWPLSQRIEKIYLYNVDFTACKVFTDLFSAVKLTILNVSQVNMTHGQLDSLCVGLSSARNLRQLPISSLTCLTHENNEDGCKIQLDFSRHKKLEALLLWDLKVGEISYVRLCQKMKNLKKVWLGGVRMSADGLKKTIMTLPQNGVWIELWGPSRVTGAEQARQLLEQVRRSPHREITRDRVVYSEDMCIINEFTFYNNKQRPLFIRLCHC